MFDLKTLRSALVQLEEERKIPKEKIIDAIEQSLAAAYKKEYGKKGQIVRAHFDLDSGETSFEQVKIVVDESLVRIVEEDEEIPEEEEVLEDGDTRVRYNPEHHIFLEDAQIIRKDVKLEDELVFPLELKTDFGRIAAQTAKQVIIQRIREAERGSIISEYGGKEGQVINGYVSKVERGIIYVDFNRATGVIPFEEQIPGERYNRGDRIKAYLYAVEESPRGVNLKLSRSHPKFLFELFAVEAPEIASGIVEIKSIAREAGSRSKIAVYSNDDNVDPVGSCVGQRGSRVGVVSAELFNEKIDIIEWSEDPKTFVAKSLSPARVLDIEINEEEHKVSIEVADDQLSLAIGKGGQNVRLAAKLTGWRIDIKGTVVEQENTLKEESGENISNDEEKAEELEKDSIDQAKEAMDETDEQVEAEIADQTETASEEE